MSLGKGKKEEKKDRERRKEDEEWKMGEEEVTRDSTVSENVD